MIAMAVSGNRDQRPDTSMRMPQARATSARRKVTLITSSVRVVVERACRLRAVAGQKRCCGLARVLIADACEEACQWRENGVEGECRAAQTHGLISCGVGWEAWHVPCLS